MAKISAASALARRESRFHPYHYRADFPQTDDENYCGLMVIQKQSSGEVTTRLDRLKYAA